jgi:hypothetical protein
MGLQPGISVCRNSGSARGAYFSSERTFCWLWLAWAIIALEACEDLRLGKLRGRRRIVGVLMRLRAPTGW